MRNCCICLLGIMICAHLSAGTFQYTKEPMPRDLIVELAHLYQDLHWRLDADNLYTGITNAECYYSSTGWQNGAPYCWGGADEFYEFLEKMTDGLGAGDKLTGQSDPYHSGLVGGVDCSGYVSQCFRSGRYSTSSFHNVTDAIDWNNLAPGDAINWAGHHIRLCEKYTTDTGLIQVYESTGSSGPWRVIRRIIAHDNNYVAVRYQHTTTMPSMLDVMKSSDGQATITWFGQATAGFRIYQSTDGSAWSLAANEVTLDADTYSADITGLLPNQLYQFRITSVSGTTESGPSHTFPVQLTSSGTAPVLLVYSYDRWLRQYSGSNFNDLLVYYGAALHSLGIAFDSCDNLRITRSEINMQDYAAVIWMLGEESYYEHTFNSLEIAAVQDYLKSGGCVYVSGTNIGWDLVAHEPGFDNLEIDESDFFRDFLKAEYHSADADTYVALGAAGSIFESLAVDFDNGTHGTYNASSPDVLAATGGAVSCLLFSGGLGGQAGVQYSGMFPGGTLAGKMVHMSIPFETIYPETSREDVMERVMTFFEVLSTPTPTPTPTPTATPTSYPLVLDGKLDSNAFNLGADAASSVSFWTHSNIAGLLYAAVLKDVGSFETDDLLYLMLSSSEARPNALLRPTDPLLNDYFFFPSGSSVTSVVPGDKNTGDGGLYLKVKDQHAQLFGNLGTPQVGIGTDTIELLINLTDEKMFTSTLNGWVFSVSADATGTMKISLPEPITANQAIDEASEIFIIDPGATDIEKWRSYQPSEKSP
jgi:Fibronectin type III domain